jgi:hypothetical protein
MKLYELCEYFTSLARSNTEELSIGEDISPIPELKIIFDGYGYDEETETDGSNINIETFAFFVHKDALTDGFKFPVHEQTPWALIHRPNQEVCIHIFYEVSEDYWGVNFPGDVAEGNSQTYDSVEETLVTLFKRYEFE